MERKKILLILVLFLWVSLTEEVPGFFRDRSVPSKLGLGLWKKHKARDQHESEDARTMDIKQTEESSDIEVRHTLPIQDTTGFLPENDVTYVAYCHYKVVAKDLPDFDYRGYTYTPVTTYPETICDPPDDDYVIVGNDKHQRCPNTQSYCFTRRQKVEIVYKANGRRGVKFYRHNIFLRTGCVCGTPEVNQKR